MRQQSFTPSMVKLSALCVSLHLLRYPFSAALYASPRIWVAEKRYFCDMTQPSKKANAANKPIHDLCEYNIVAGDRYVRYVKPYFQDFRTFAKGRWIGREILEVFCREFGAHPPSYWVNAMRNGQVRINNKIVAPTYKICNGDAVLHRTHRHEPPVFGEIVLVGESDEIVAISKPPSLPMHPCGAYRHNSLEYILKREHLVDNQPTLSVVHRLDRVTSGLVVLAKTKAAAAKISEEIRDKATTKVYLARVKGRFPTHPADLPHLRALQSIDLAEFAEEAEDYQLNGFSEDSGLPAKRAKEGEESGSAGKQGNKKVRSAKKDAFGRGEDVNVEDLPPRLRETLSAEEVGRAANVGVLFASPVADQLEQQEGSKRSGVVHSRTHGSTAPEGSSETAGKDEKPEACTVPEIWVQCPLGVISQRDGVHACDPTGKPSLSIFRSLGYCVDSDTTLVECRPYTGRTHQLRLHLHLLGTPIANDPCYGGVLFYGDPERRAQAIAAVREMREKGIIPLSKVPHFGDPAVDNLLITLKPSTAAVDPLDGLQSDSTAVGDDGEQVAAAPAQEPREGESEDDYLIRTCRYCQENSSAELEQLLHCDGIWLHALRYTGPPVRTHRAPAPAPMPVAEQEQSVAAVVAGGETRQVDYGDVSEGGDGADNKNNSGESHVRAVGKEGRRWSFQAPYPSWATPFGLVNSK